MNESLACMRCNTPMEIGFVPDTTYGGQLQESWAAGAPEVSFWTGIKVRGEVLPVTTSRCPKCGYLESYARASA